MSEKATLIVFHSMIIAVIFVVTYIFGDLLLHMIAKAKITETGIDGFITEKPLWSISYSEKGIINLVRHGVFALLTVLVLRSLVGKLKMLKENYDFMDRKDDTTA